MCVGTSTYNTLGQNFSFTCKGTKHIALAVNSDRQVVSKYFQFYLFFIANFGILICFDCYDTRLFSGIIVKIILSQMLMLKVYLMFYQNTIVSSGMVNIEVKLLKTFAKINVNSSMI